VNRNEENDKIREKIRKLLNLANDPGAMKGEIDNAMRFANRLMMQHNLSEEDVRADAEPKGVHEIAAAVEATEYAQGVHAGMGSRFTAWESRLGSAITLLIGTISYYTGGYLGERRTPEGVLIFNPHTGEPVRAASMTFYGPTEDVEAAKALMYEWSTMIVAMARLKYGGALRGPGRSYAEGFADELYSKVFEIKGEERLKAAQLAPGERLDIKRLASGTVEEKAIVLAERSSALALSNAMTLVAAKKERGREWLEKDCGIELSSGSSRGGGSYDPGAHSAGRTDGRKASGSFGYSRRPKLGGGS
jgi:hypothetical protein